MFFDLPPSVSIVQGFFCSVPESHHRSPQSVNLSHFIGDHQSLLELCFHVNPYFSPSEVSWMIVVMNWWHVMLFKSMPGVYNVIQVRKTASINQKLSSKFQSNKCTENYLRAMEHAWEGSSFLNVRKCNPASMTKRLLNKLWHVRLILRLWRSRQCLMSPLFCLDNKIEVITELTADVVVVVGLC